MSFMPPRGPAVCKQTTTSPISGIAAPERRPQLKLKSWDTACTELLAEYRKVDVVAMRKGSSSARRYAKGVLVAVMYPAFWLLTVIMTLAVIILCLLRTAVGGISVRTFCRAKASHASQRARAKASHASQRAKQLALGVLRTKPSFLFQPDFSKVTYSKASHAAGKAGPQRKLHVE